MRDWLEKIGCEGAFAVACVRSQFLFIYLLTLFIYFVICFEQSFPPRLLPMIKLIFHRMQFPSFPGSSKA